jgi:hypothetical protein
LQIAAALLAIAGGGVVDQHLSHHPGRESEKMLPALPVRAVVGD